MTKAYTQGQSNISIDITANRYNSEKECLKIAEELLYSESANELFGYAGPDASIEFDDTFTCDATSTEYQSYAEMMKDFFDYEDDEPSYSIRGKSHKDNELFTLTYASSFDELINEVAHYPWEIELPDNITESQRKFLDKVAEFNRMGETEDALKYMKMMK